MSETSPCPCCGQPVARNRVLVDWSRLAATFEGVEVRFPRMELALIEVLAQAWPNAVSCAELASRIGIAGPIPKRSLRVHVYRVREKLRHNLRRAVVDGVGVETVYDKYRLNLPVEKTAA